MERPRQSLPHTPAGARRAPPARNPIVSCFTPRTAPCKRPVRPSRWRQSIRQAKPIPISHCRLGICRPRDCVFRSVAECSGAIAARKWRSRRIVPESTNLVNSRADTQSILFREVYVDELARGGLISLRVIEDRTAFLVGAISRRRKLRSAEQVMGFWRRPTRMKCSVQVRYDN